VYSSWQSFLILHLLECTDLNLFLETTPIFLSYIQTISFNSIHLIPRKSFKSSLNTSNIFCNL